jgi:hypothetical protein
VTAGWSGPPGLIQIHASIPLRRVVFPLAPLAPCSFCLSRGGAFAAFPRSCLQVAQTCAPHATQSVATGAMRAGKNNFHPILPADCMADHGRRWDENAEGCSTDASQKYQMRSQSAPPRAGDSDAGLPYRESKCPNRVTAPQWRDPCFIAWSFGKSVAGWTGRGRRHSLEVRGIHGPPGTEPDRAFPQHLAPARRAVGEARTEQA